MGNEGEESDLLQKWEHFAAWQGWAMREDKGVWFIAMIEERCGFLLSITCLEPPVTLLTRTMVAWSLSAQYTHSSCTATPTGSTIPSVTSTLLSPPSKSHTSILCMIMSIQNTRSSFSSTVTAVISPRLVLTITSLRCVWRLKISILAPPSSTPPSIVTTSSCFSAWKPRLIIGSAHHERTYGYHIFISQPRHVDGVGVGGGPVKSPRERIYHQVEWREDFHLGKHSSLVTFSSLLGPPDDLPSWSSFAPNCS